MLIAMPLQYNEQAMCQPKKRVYRRSKYALYRANAQYLVFAIIQSQRLCVAILQFIALYGVA